MAITRSRHHLAEQEAREFLRKVTMSRLINKLYSCDYDSSFDEDEDDYVAPRRNCLCQFIISLFSSFTR